MVIRERILEPAHNGATLDRAEPWIGGHSGIHRRGPKDKRQANKTLSKDSSQSHCCSLESLPHTCVLVTAQQYEESAPKMKCCCHSPPRTHNQLLSTPCTALTQLSPNSFVIHQTKKLKAKAKPFSKMRSMYVLRSRFHMQPSLLKTQIWKTHSTCPFYS